MSKILQLKIDLLKTKPKIWRRVQIKDIATFWELHVVIRNAYEWSDEQPHYFKITDNKKKNILIRSYLDEYETNKFPLSWNIGIKKYLSDKKNLIYYIYGSNENHKHLITLENTFYRKLKVKYPICTAGHGIPDESDSEEESLIAKQIKSCEKFNPSDVVLTEGNRALQEHKVKMFDHLFS